jgi:carbonic anhydrase
MSVWPTANNWADSYAGCGTANQSPIDLTTKNAIVCSQKCEFTMGDTFVTQPMVNISQSSDFLRGMPDGPGGPPPATCTYNGGAYDLTRFALYNPAQHTIDGHRYDAEFVMTFINRSTSEFLSVSVLLQQTSSKSTASRDFFHALVAACPLLGPGQMEAANLGKNVSFSHALPKDPSYFVYAGSSLTPPCDGGMTWIVHRHPVMISSDDLADVQRQFPAGFRPTQEVGATRQIMFNDGQNAVQSEETLKTNDHRLYIAVKRIHQDQEARKARKAQDGLKVPVTFGSGATGAASGKTWMDHAQETHHAIQQIGWGNALMVPGLCLAVLALVWLARSLAKYVLTGGNGSILTNAGWLSTATLIVDIVFWPWVLLMAFIRSVLKGDGASP